jgi:hypothetical protein
MTAAGALPESPEHKFYAVPDYPGYSGVCECLTPFGPRTTREAVHRDYRTHFAVATSNPHAQAERVSR